MLDPTSVVSAPELGHGGCIMMAAVGMAEEWNGVVERTISATLESVWSVASDFLRFPNLLTIESVEGENGVPGCTREVSNLPSRTDSLSPQWAKQKLVEIDSNRHHFSYEFLENNTGVDPGYYSTFQAQQDGGRTLVRWAFRSAFPKLARTALCPTF